MAGRALKRLVVWTTGAAALRHPTTPMASIKRVPDPISSLSVVMAAIPKRGTSTLWTQPVSKPDIIIILPA